MALLDVSERTITVYTVKKTDYFDLTSAIVAILQNALGGYLRGADANKIALQDLAAALQEPEAQKAFNVILKAMP